MTDEVQKSDNDALSFEQSLERLQRIVLDLEEGKLGLEASLSQFEQGTRLLQACFRILEQAELRVQVLTGMNEAGDPELAPFDNDATASSETDTAEPKRRKKSTRGRVREQSDSGSEEGGLFD